ncbi:flagellar basal body L-ring protein FlgH [Buchnera aphidicola]|uniref:flagellar basal body L-ring protein FlgH n=1 Tax=Buchnera aphidicola TaxID=9 RepID=UPI0031B7170A
MFKNFLKILNFLLLIISLSFIDSIYARNEFPKKNNIIFIHNKKDKKIIYQKYYYHNWFEDKPHYQIGDNLIIFLQENIMTQNRTFNNTQNNSSTFFKIRSLLFSLISQIFSKKKNDLPFLQTIGTNVLLDDNKSLEKNTFLGMITVTIQKIFPNNHLEVAGKNSILINGNVESIRFFGIVDPNEIVNNIVPSSKISHKNIEYVKHDTSKKENFFEILKKFCINFFPNF